MKGPQSRRPASWGQVFELAKGVPGVYTVLGVKLCREQFLRQVGIGKRNWKLYVEAAKEGRNHPPTDRRTIGRWRARVKEDSANKFFLWLYNHEAETLPDLRDHHVHGEVLSSDESGSDMPPQVTGPEVHDIVAHRLGCIDAFQVSGAASSHDDAVSDMLQHKHFEVRYLSWNTFRGLFRQYQAMCEVLNLAPCGLTTFWQVYKQKWRSCLRRRTRNQHGKCDDCEDFKEHLRKASCKADVDKLVRDYTHHMRAQFADRQVYYSTRGASESFFRWVVDVGAGGDSTQKGLLLEGQSSISLILDGMDQAKFRIPRTGDGGGMHSTAGVA